MKNGFSLIEILLVILITGVIAAVVIPRLTKSGLYESYEVYTAARLLSSDLRLVQRLAVTTGAVHKLECWAEEGSSDENRYAIYRQDDGSWTEVSEIKEIPDDIRVTGDTSAVFNPDGTCDADHTFRYREGGHDYRVNVREETGRVRMWEA